MKLLNTFTHILSTLILSFTLAACDNSQSSTSQQHQDSLTKIKEYGVIKIGVFGDKPPFGDIDANGRSQGFDIEIARALSNDLFGNPDQVEFLLTRAADRVDYLQSGRVDIILANFTQTPERSQLVDFSDPYMKIALGIVSHKDNLITDISQLRGKRLLVNKGTTAEAYFKKHHPEIQVISFDQNTETFDALKKGRGTAMAHDNALLWAWAKENPNFEVSISHLGNIDHIAPAVQKGDVVLQKWVNERIKAMKQDGRLQQAYQKTLKPVYGNSVSSQDLLAN